MVTAETALVLPVLMLVAVMLTVLVSWGTAQAQVNESARNVARLVARGDSSTEVDAWLRRNAPGSKVTTKRGDGQVTVSVSKRVSSPVFPPWVSRVEGSATVVAE